MGLVINARRVIQAWIKMKGTTRPCPTALPLLRAAVVVMGGRESEESLVSSHRVCAKGRQARWELGEMR